MGESKRRILLNKSNNAEGQQQQTTTSWRSIYVASGLSFVGAVQFSLYFSSMWQYLKIIDTAINEQFYGYVIAVYSVGQIASAPTFGYVSNKLRQVRFPLQIGLAMMFIGNSIYMLLHVAAPFVPARYLCMVGRLIIGVGSGNSSLLRSYVSTASSKEDRSRAIAWVTCGQAFGQVAGPAFQLIFNLLSYPGAYGLNMYTAPAYFACFLNVVGALVLVFLFKEQFACAQQTHKSTTDSANVDENNVEQANTSIVCEKEAPSSPPPSLPPYDRVAVVVCNVTRFTQMFIQVNLETIGGPLAMMMFGWDEAQAVSATSAAQSAVGLLTFAFYLVYIYFSVEKYVNFRWSNIAALVALLAFHLLTYSWPFLPTHVPTFVQTTTLNRTTSPAVGCNASQFGWCTTLTQVDVRLYYGAYVLLIGLAFPALNIAMSTLFSYILGARSQGTQQGVLQMSGGLSRFIGPILLSKLYSVYGPTMTWNVEIAVVGATLLLWAIFYRRMVSLGDKKAPKKALKSCWTTTTLASIVVARRRQALFQNAMVQSSDRFAMPSSKQTADNDHQVL